MEEFGSLLPETLNFKVGYFLESSQPSKYRLMCQKDLEVYLSKSKGSLMLWCNARISSNLRVSGKRNQKISHHLNDSKEKMN